MNLDKIRDHPLYKKSFEAFKNGDHETGIKLLNILQNDDNANKDIKNFYEENDKKIKNELKNAGFIMIDKDEEIPDGYNRNSFSDKTCISTQKKDLPAWKDITSVIKYEDKIVYEDHYTTLFTTNCMLSDIKNKHPGSFIGYIITSSSIKDTINKFRKNSLYLIIDTLNIQVSNISYSIIDLLNNFLDIDTLLTVTIVHKDKIYDATEKKLIRSFFSKTKWDTLKITEQFEFTK
jgi:hypothetical protein